MLRRNSSQDIATVGDASVRYDITTPGGGNISRAPPLSVPNFGMAAQANAAVNAFPAAEAPLKWRSVSEPVRFVSIENRFPSFGLIASAISPFNHLLKVCQTVSSPHMLS